MTSGGLGHAPGQSAEVQLVSLLGCFEELLVECLSARSKFISGQTDCLTSNVVLKVPAEAARAWIRGMLSTPKQLQTLTTSSLIQYLKASEFFQDSHQVKVLCGVLGERLFSTDASATSHGNEQPSAKRPRLHTAHMLDQLPTDLVIEVLRCAPGSMCYQLRRLPQSLSSLVALAALPALGAACTLPSDCTGASSDLPTLTLCVDLGQADDADAAALASADATGHDAGLFRGSNVAQGSSISVDYDDESNPSYKEDSLFSLQQRPHVVACPLLTCSDALTDLNLDLPDRTCLVLDSRSAVLDVRRAKFEGGAVVCMGSTCLATFHDAVFDRCSLVVMGGAQAALHSPRFMNMDRSEARLSVFAHGSGSHVHMHGGGIHGGVQGVAVHAAARLEASDLTVSGLQYVGLEVSDPESMLTVQKGTINRFLSFREVDDNFLDGEGDICAQYGVCVHSDGCVQLSGVVIEEMREGCSVSSSAAATLTDCTVSDTHSHCLIVRACGTAQLDKSTLSCRAENSSALLVWHTGSHVSATACHLHSNIQSSSDGAIALSGGKLTAHSCKTSGNLCGYRIDNGVMELLNCTSDGDDVGCCLQGGLLTATNVTVTNSRFPGFGVETGNAELRSCSVTGCRIGRGMLFGGLGPREDGGPSVEAQLQDCTVTQNHRGGFHALEGVSVAVTGCRSRDNGGVGFEVGGGGQMTVAHSSSDGDTVGCVAHGDGAGGGVLTMEEVTVDGVVQSGTLPVTYHAVHT